MKNDSTEHDQPTEAELIQGAVAEFAPSKDVERITAADLEQLLAPHTVSLKTWLVGILSDDEFPEEDPDEVALGMLAQVMMAESSEEALAIFQLDRAKDMCGNEPGGRSNVLSITGARPLKSTYDEGSACYVIVQAIDLAENKRIQFTTGSKAVQVLLIKHISEGWLPFKAQLEIRKQPTRRGFHPISLIGGI